MDNRVPPPALQGSAPDRILAQQAARERQTPSAGPTAPRDAPVDPRLKQAAEGMESLFLDYLFKVMRKNVPETEFSLESPATKIYRGMLDSEYAKVAAKTGGIGLADLIIAHAQESGYNGRARAAGQHPPKHPAQGGDHEGQSPE